MKMFLPILATGIICFTGSCISQSEEPNIHAIMDNDTIKHSYTNDLIKETSPYLLQHAHNPVNWHAWGEEALNKAKMENKMILISIGYSACHWCHVMEKESFEDEEVAAYMNERFICIKVDREERPDVDQVYMEAVQLITGRGGWPLNCFALPDGRPFYGGTYFPKKNWLYLLQNVVKEYESDRAKVESYANDLTANINRVHLAPEDTQKLEEIRILESTISQWRQNFDNKEGGPNRAPKFPLPNNYQFLMDYAIITHDEELLDHVELTLNKMALGGIYDQAGGGFARYSTDGIWKVPHFEKMLYDNAQLVSLYSKAYQHFKNPLYRDVVEQSLEFISRELTGPVGEFYSALDADSEGEEGKFYVWSEEELADIKGLDVDFVKKLYRINPVNKWEGHYILHRNENEDEVRKSFGLSDNDFREKIKKTNQLLLEERSKRIRPGLDDKSLTSWNALMISGYVDAYRAFGTKEYLERAVKNAQFIWDVQFKDKKVLLHNYKAGVSTIPAFLEDYAYAIQAFTDLYQVSFEQVWLDRAQVYADICIKSFYNEKERLFFFTSEDEKLLVARKIEVNDNVTPAANSSMARNLYLLGNLTDNKSYSQISRSMMNRILPGMASYGSGYSNWGFLALAEAFPFYEIAVVGPEYNEIIKRFGSRYIPNSVLLGSPEESTLPLLEHKYVKGETMIYVCVDKSCKLPETEVDKAVEQIRF